MSSGIMHSRPGIIGRNDMNPRKAGKDDALAHIGIAHK